MATIYQRLREFFIRNPEEELTAADVSVKFGCSDSSAQAAISKLTSDRMLDRRKEGQTVYYFPRCGA